MADSAFKITGLEGVLQSLQALPKELTQKAGGPVRKALRKGAIVIRDEARRNAARIVAHPNVGPNESTGLMEKSIVVVKGKPHRTLNGERMFVLIPKRRRYPFSPRTPTGISVAMVGRMLEYGTSKRKPMPWARPAFHSKKGEAVAVIVKELPAEIDKIVRKLSRQNRR